MVDLWRVRVTLAGWQGAPGLATHYFAEDASPAGSPPERAEEVSNRVRDAWTPICNMEPNIWTATVQPVVDVLNASTGDLVDSYTIDPLGVLSGAEGTKFGPAASGICVNWLTNTFISGRRVRGRTFISPINDGIDANGTPTAPHVAAAASMFAILEAHSAGEPTFVVWHRPVGGAGGAEAPVTGTAVRDSGSVLTSRR